jgi:hypothetical protein
MKNPFPEAEHREIGERSLASGGDEHVIKCARLFRWGGNYIRNFGGRVRNRPDVGLFDAAGTMGRAGSTSEKHAPVRVILPASAEPAQPPQPLQSEQPTTTFPASESQPHAQQVKEVQAPPEMQVEKPDTRRAEAEQRERRRRSAEHKAKKLTIARARQQLEQQSRERAPAVMAFGGNDQPQMIGFFGN